ncbi:DgyrCDS9356 [Dimorphilus gyrociliatus]|uniref:DgyrCDS9356 n=2 Tax=Dimorphilus gyrociliatus TaxID=2664684 RepID=A0A7I8VWS0_9ANNE|nr:DgyrCDS9356 [Dimorphilus gyrociliatus]
MDNSPDSETDAQPKRMISSNELDSIQKDLKAAIQNHAALGIKAKQFPDDKSIRVELDGLAEKIMVLNDKQKEVVNKIRQLSNATKQNKQEAPAILSKVSIMSRRPNVSRSPSILSPAKSPNRNLPSPKVQIASNFPAQHKPRKSELKPRCHSPPIKVPSFQPSTPPSPATPPINRSPSITPSKKAKMYNAPKVRSVEKRTSPPPDNTMEHEEPVYPFSNGWLSSEKNPEKSAELQFMWSLKLVPIAQAEEMRKRRSERKRRSTANPQFSYSNSAGGDRFRGRKYYSVIKAVKPLKY